MEQCVAANVRLDQLSWSRERVRASLMGRRGSCSSYGLAPTSLRAITNKVLFKHLKEDVYTVDTLEKRSGLPMVWYY